MKARCVRFAFLLAFLLPAPSAWANTTLVVNLGAHPSAEVAGHAEGEVNWLDGDPSDDTICTEAFAALELQHFLRKMTGRRADFVIVDDDNQVGEGDLILLGSAASNAASRSWAAALGVEDEPFAGLGPQGYRIKSTAIDGRRVTWIAGGGRVGTLYGAYDLLHRLGCRWFAPGPLHEEVPRIEEIGDFDVTEQPSFLTRGFFAWEDRADEEFLLWMARNRLNLWCVEQSNHPLLRKLGILMDGGMHDAEELFLNPHGPYPYDHPKFVGDEQKPADPYPLSPAYQDDADHDGTISYFEAHPEWYALENGRRIPGIQGCFGTNYCTSNPHATAEFMKNYVQAVIAGPYRDADIIRFWTLDAAKWCECEACQALGTPTDRNLLLVHRFDQEIKKARAAGKIERPIVIHFLAYADVLEPPSRPLPSDFDDQTCLATFFPIVRCYVHTFDDPACTRNLEYLRQIRGWAVDPKRHYRGQIVLGEYYNVSRYKCLPICFMHTMAHDIPYYYELGARHFHYMHVTTGNWGTRALTNYQMARQLWDVTTDCETLWADYFTRRYGPAAATMRSFYESLEKMLANVSELKYGLARRLNRGAEELFPTSHLRYRREPNLSSDGPALLEIVEHAKTCRRLIDQALAAGPRAPYHARIAEDERVFTYGERTVAYFHACVEAFQLGRAGKRDEARQHFAEAVRLARLLREDTVSTSLSSEHANAPDAFTATLATEALDHLASLLGPLDAADEE